MPRSTFAREAGHAARGQRCVSCTSTTQQAAIGRGAVCRHTRWHNTARVTQTSKRTVAPAAMAVPATPKRPGAAYVSALSLSRVRFSPDMGSSSNRSLWAPGFIAVTCSAPPLGGRDARGDAAIGAARGCYQGYGWGPMRVSGSCYPTITPGIQLTRCRQQGCSWPAAHFVIRVWSVDRHRIITKLSQFQPRRHLSSSCSVLVRPNMCLQDTLCSACVPLSLR